MSEVKTKVTKYDGKNIPDMKDMFFALLEHLDLEIYEITDEYNQVVGVSIETRELG